MCRLFAFLACHLHILPPCPCWAVFIFVSLSSSNRLNHDIRIHSFWWYFGQIYLVLSTNVTHHSFFIFSILFEPGVFRSFSIPHQNRPSVSKHISFAWHHFVYISSPWPMHNHLFLFGFMLWCLFSLLLKSIFLHVCKQTIDFSFFLTSCFHSFFMHKTHQL